VFADESAAYPGLLLPVLYFTSDTEQLSLHAYLLRIYCSGAQEIRSIQRAVACLEADLPLSPLGGERIRPGSLAIQIFS